MSMAPEPTRAGPPVRSPRAPDGGRSTLGRSVLVLALVAALGVAGCGDGSSEATPSGSSTPRGVVDAHVTAMGLYDLTAACELFAPSVRAEMARWDDTEVDGYCATATAEVLALARDSDRARVERIYRDASVEELPLGGTDEHWFEVRSGDGTYDEQLKVVEEEGLWWVAEVISEPMEGSVREEPPD